MNRRPAFFTSNDWPQSDESTDRTIKYKVNLYPVVSREKRLRDMERFIAVAKKEHYNEMNYGKYFIV